MNEADQRKALGAERVGAPVLAIREGIARLAAMEEYQQIRFDAVEYYCERLLYRELIKLIAESFELDQLAALDPDTVKIAFLLLLRDMMQSHRAAIVKQPETQTWDTQRIEQFIAGLFYEAQAPLEPYQDWLEMVAEAGQEPSQMLVVGLAQQLGMDPSMLMAYHSAACEITQEDILSSP